MLPSQFHLIANARGRNPQSLDGEWRVQIDPYASDGELEIDRMAGDVASPTGTDRTPPRLCFEDAAQLTVPGDWNSQRTELFWYEGSVWYEKRFEAAPRPGERAFLRFCAANYRACVYLNGERVGSHTGGFTEFEFEVTGRLRSGPNVLLVKVDNARHAHGIPTRNHDWTNFGGLTRSVWLLTLPSTFIHDYFLQLKKGSRCELVGWVLLDGEQAPFSSVRLTIEELGIDQTFAADAEGRAEIEIDCSRLESPLELWQCEAPRRYLVKLATGADAVSEFIGFRSIEVQGTDILLNGKPIFLRGIALHEQAPERTGRATSESDARRLLGWAKELGCNFLRLAHYPHGDYMLQVAEELGLLVWSEVPVYWTIEWGNLDTYENAERQLTEMINRDKNRAAVVLWSVANETPISEMRTRFLGKLVDTVRSLDSTRLVTAALEIHYPDETTLALDDPLGSQLDVIGCNEYIGWYIGLPELADRVTWRIAYQKPLIFSELGGDAKAGLHGLAEERWTEEFQEDLYIHQIPMMQRVPVWRGLTPWILHDFQSVRRPLPHIQDGWNRKGLISDRGERKKAFYVLQKFYRELASDGYQGGAAR